MFGKLVMQDGRGNISGCNDLKYLCVIIDEETRQENDIEHRINKGRLATVMLNGIL